MNDTIKVLLDRRSVRVYDDRPVSKEDLDTIVKCGQYAASANGRQPWHFTVITDRALLDRISAANRDAVLADPNTPADAREAAMEPAFHSFRGAPAAILVSAENDRVNTIADCANATENMAIAAKALGLGSCYLASHKAAMIAPGGEALKKAAGTPDGYIPYFALAVGYPAEDPAPAPRRAGTVSYLG